MKNYTWGLSRSAGKKEGVAFNSTCMCMIFLELNGLETSLSSI